MATTQARRFVLTINNELRTDDELCSYVQGLEHFKYCMFQREKGHETGTEHIQMFLVFTIGKRFATVKEYFPTAHIEKAQGSSVQCRDYCSKSDTRISGPYELGEFAQQGSRTDLKTIVELVQANASDEDILRLYPSQFLLYSEKIQRLRDIQRYNECKTKERKVHVTYIYGPKGSGKSSYIRDTFGYGNFYRVTNYKKNPFDFYAGEKVIVFEEFYNSFSIEDMLNYLDIYPVQLPCRYSNKMANYDRVFIISNFPLKDQYKNVQSERLEQYQALLRRIHKIIYIDSDHRHHIERDIQPYPSVQASIPDRLLAAPDSQNEIDSVFARK